MMGDKTLSLFPEDDDFDDDERHKLSRRDDPQTSKDAAKKMNLSKRRKEALILLIANPGCTSNELDAKARNAQGRVRKRLTDLRYMEYAFKGDKRESKDTKFDGHEWFPTEKGIRRMEMEPSE